MPSTMPNYKVGWNASTDSRDKLFIGAAARGVHPPISSWQHSNIQINHKITGPFWSGQNNAAGYPWGRTFGKLLQEKQNTSRLHIWLVFLPFGMSLGICLLEELSWFMQELPCANKHFLLVTQIGLETFRAKLAKQNSDWDGRHSEHKTWRTDFWHQSSFRWHQRSWY